MPAFPWQLPRKALLGSWERNKTILTFDFLMAAGAVLMAEWSHQSVGRFFVTSVTAGMASIWIFYLLALLIWHQKSQPTIWHQVGKDIATSATLMVASPISAFSMEFWRRSEQMSSTDLWVLIPAVTVFLLGFGKLLALLAKDELV